MKPMFRSRLRPWGAACVTLVTLAGVAATAPTALATAAPSGQAAEHAHPLPPGVEAIMHKPGYKTAQWGLYEVDPSNGEVIHSRFARQSFVPGSDTQPVLRTSAVQDPNAFGRTALIEALGRAGVTVTARPTGPNPLGALPPSYTHDPRVAAFVSPPYRQYAKLILKVSHNLGANLALCNMAVLRGSKDCLGAGFAVEHDFLTKVAHVDPTQFQLDDGRGGDATEKVTPVGLAQLLDYWLHTPDATAFRLSLPILGVNGSNATSCTNCPAKGKVFAKPGTVVGLDRLNGLLSVADQSQAGYLLTDDGHLLIFAVLVNSATATDIQDVARIFDDTNQISALLQEEASAHL